MTAQRWHRSLRLGLTAIMFALLVTVAAKPAPAAAACTWSSLNTIQTSRTVADGATWTGKVTYKIQTCNGVRSQLFIDTFTHKMTFTNAISSNVYHEDQTAKVFRYFNGFYGTYLIQWQTFSAFSCNGNCSLTRVVNQDITMPYYSTAATMGYWVGCGSTPANNCRVAYKFLQGIVVIENL